MSSSFEVIGGWLCAEIELVNLAERFLSHPQRREALIVGDRSFTYGELYLLAGRWRGGLQAADVGPGDRVAVIAGNDETFVVAHVAIAGIGAVTVPLNPQSPPAALAGELAMINPAAAVVGSTGRDAWSGLAEGERPPLLDGEILARSDPVPIAPVQPDDPAVLLLTSGTAGAPRPAILTHANLNASLDAMFALPIDLRATHHVMLAVIPLFHVFGLNVIVNLGLAAGATLVLEDYTTPGRTAELVAERSVTVLTGPPTLWQALAGSGDVRAEQLQTVQLAVSGAAKLAPEVGLLVRQRLEVDLVEGYGLTETGGVAATAVGAAAPPGSVGRLLPGVEARLVDANGLDVLVGDPGELWLRGPMVSPGYLEDGTDEGSPGAIPGEPGPPATGRSDGWLRTGDIAVVDDGGNLSIVDRIKDVVIVSGFNVYPGEVEAVLLAHPDVAEAGVVGSPDPVTGEVVVAHVVPVVGRDLPVEDLIEHCRQHLARYKVPKRIEIRSDLPLGATGKVRRREL
jgi:long-chain acyl-CoA synthetase